MLTSDWYCTFRGGGGVTCLPKWCTNALRRFIIYNPQEKKINKNGGLRPDLCSPVSNASVTKVIFFISSMYFLF